MSLNVTLLKESFVKFAPHSEHLADRFFEILFSDFPMVQTLFDNANMKDQKKALISTLVFIIDNLEKPEVLADGLYQLGARHVKYNIKESQFPAIGRTLIKVFSEIAGDDWNAELEEAWSDAYAAIQFLTIKGFQESNKRTEIQST